MLFWTFRVFLEFLSSAAPKDSMLPRRRPWGRRSSWWSGHVPHPQGRRQSSSLMSSRIACAEWPTWWDLSTNRGVCECRHMHATDAWVSAGTCMPLMHGWVQAHACPWCMGQGQRTTHESVLSCHLISRIHGWNLGHQACKPDLLLAEPSCQKRVQTWLLVSVKVISGT